MKSRLRGLARFGLIATVTSASMAPFAACRSEDASASTDGARLDLTLDNINRNNTGARGVTLSPDGRRLLISGSGPEGAGLYLTELEPNDGAGTGASTFSESRLWLQGSSPSWAPDSRRLAYLANGSLWLAAVDDPEVRTLATNLEGARAASFSPDGQNVAFYSTASGHQDIWLVPVDGSGPARQLTDAAMALDDPRFTPAWSPDSRSIAYVSNASDYWHDDLWLIDVESGERRQLTTSLMAMSSPVWSPDGSGIAVFGTAKDEYWYEDLAYIYVIDPTTGDERIVDMQVYATDAAMRYSPSWSADGEHIYFPYLERGISNVWTVPAAGGVATRITNLKGSLSSLDHTAGAGRLAFVHSTPTHGGEAFVLETSGGSPRRVTGFAPAWDEVRAPIEVSYPSFDGLTIQGFLYLPPEVGSGATCPALIQVHGGGTNSYQQGLNLTEQYLASRGFVVLAINYRGGSGFGREFQDLAVEDWLGDQARDAGAAADFLRTLPYANGKVGIYGGSYGGSMSLSAISLTPDKFDAAVPMRGAYSKLNTLDYTDRLGKIFSVTGHGGTPEERPEIYAKSDVVSRIDAITAPVLLMHGELDRRVPIQNFHNAVAEFERLGKPVEVKTFPEEGHGFRSPENRIEMYSRLENFFNRHLGGCTSS